jgi:hypothetical protein
MATNPARDDLDKMMRWNILMGAIRRTLSREGVDGETFRATVNALPGVAITPDTWFKVLYRGSITSAVEAKIKDAVLSELNPDDYDTMELGRLT